MIFSSAGSKRAAKTLIMLNGGHEVVSLPLMCVCLDAVDSRFDATLSCRAA